MSLFFFLLLVPLFLLCCLLPEGCLVDVPHGLALHFVTCLWCCFNPVKLQSVFQRPKRTYPAHPWQSRTVPDPQCLDATELNRALLPNQYGKSCRSFLDGVGPCKRQFGNRNVCQGLSLDLSSVLNSTCHSRHLILEIHPWVRSLPRSRAHGPIHAFHRHLLHLLHLLWHIHFQVVHQLHHVHLQCHVHPLKRHRPALHPFLRPNLVKLVLHTRTHQEVTQRLMTAAHMDSISILIGKRIKTTTTIRRSTAWPSLVAFVNQPSRKNWTSKDVILWNYRWQPCCINRRTTFGFGSWLMGVNSTWFRLVTLQLLYSWRSSWLNSATRG